MYQVKIDSYSRRKICYKFDLSWVENTLHVLLGRLLVGNVQAVSD